MRILLIALLMSLFSFCEAHAYTSEQWAYATSFVAYLAEGGEAPLPTVEQMLILLYG
jgi:hypothetical protein